MSKPIKQLPSGAWLKDLHRGDTWEPQINVVDGKGIAVGITGATVEFTAKSDPTKSATVIKKTSAVSGEIDLTNPAAGIFQLFLIPGDTNTLTPDDYKFDFQITTAAGKKYTIIDGTLTILTDITRPAT